MNDHPAREPLTITLPADLVDALATEVSDRILQRLVNQPGHEPWPEWMAIDTAARYLDVSPQRLRKQVARREIPYHQEDKGCRILFRRTDLDDWMAGFYVPARAPGSLA
jgi:excisionase family DNA binding protein